MRCCRCLVEAVESL